MSQLFSIFGARDSKDAKRVNISLVTGKDEKSREWATISIAKDGKSKTKLEIKENKKTGQRYCVLYVPFLEEKKDKDVTNKIDDNDLPF